MSHRATHWCYVCQRPIRVRGQDVTCPNCNDGFIQEISETGGMMNTYGLFGPDFDENRDRRFGMMEAMSALMQQRMAGMSDEHESDIRRRQGMPSGMGPVLIFGSNIPADASENRGFNVLIRSGPGLGVERANFGGYLAGPSLEALFEQLLLQNSRQGPPPATQSAINSMPVVKINHRHLHADPYCPVCQDKFEVGSEAREMPCNHLYHTDCIIPWLVQHNSCPVCRHPLPTQGSASSTRSRSTNPNENSVHGVARDNPGHVARNSSGEGQGRRSTFSFLWPFGSSSSNSRNYQYERTPSDSTVYEDPSQISYPQWHYHH